MSTTYTITNIKYDTDGAKVKLPRILFIVVPDNVEGYDETDQYISDEISRRTGYCHKGFATTPEITE